MKTKIVGRVVDLQKPLRLTAAQQARLAVLAKTPDSKIDYSDIPPLTHLRRIQRLDDSVFSLLMIACGIKGSRVRGALQKVGSPLIQTFTGRFCGNQRCAVYLGRHS